MRPQQWLDMKVQDATLEQWRHSPEIWDELLRLEDCDISWEFLCLAPCIVEISFELLVENLWTQL